MKNTLKINHAEGKIVMDRTFAKLSEDTTNIIKEVKEMRTYIKILIIILMI